MSKGSLYDVLHNDTKSGFNESEKRRIARDIAVGMQGLHSISRYHGHLTSRNILLDEQNRVFIADLGLIRLKKYAGITLKYTNKSAWSSPELLRERNPTPLKPVPSDDIYSYGVLLWELLTCQIPFSGASRESLSKEMEEGNRLSIPEGVPEDLSMLIRSCWNVDPISRPSFDTILRKVFDTSSSRIN
jgi:serine/threonine protein kinase